MMGALTRIFFRTAGDRGHARYRALVAAINELEPVLVALSASELKLQAQALRNEIARGQKLDDAIVPLFALVREVARRTIGLRHFDVQLIGGMALHEGRIAEIATG